MQIVSDRGLDLAPEQLAGLPIHLVPLLLTLDGTTYRSGVDIQPDVFYRMLESSKSFPTTAQPPSGEVAELYRQIAATDPDILSFHISVGLSGTMNAARLAAQQVPEANVTFIDTMSLSGEQGWQVEAAGRAIRAGWSKERVLALAKTIRDATDACYTVATMKYLIHGGRISHMKGLLASVLQIKPIIGVNKADGKYEQLGQARTMKQAYGKFVDLVAAQHAPGTPIRAQIFHAAAEDGAAQLQEMLSARFPCQWQPTTPVSPVMGAHSGPGMVGLIFMPQAVWEQVP